MKGFSIGYLTGQNLNVQGKTRTVPDTAQTTSPPPTAPPPPSAYNGTTPNPQGDWQTLQIYTPATPGMAPSTQPGPWQPPGGEAKHPSFNWADAPDTEVEDNENAIEPSYPMNQALQPIPGYEFTSVKESKPVVPPAPNAFVQTAPENFTSVTDIDDDSAKDALIKHVKSHCCYGKKPAQEMTIESVVPSSAYHYTISTFSEQRTTLRLFAPYKGEDIERAGTVGPPAVWNLDIPPDSMFYEHEKVVNVPYTSTVDVCHGCNGRGFCKCYRCKGLGKVRCKKCKGSGMKKKETCQHCSGKGKRICFRCNGHAVITCSVCEGYKQLRFYIVVKSKYIVHNDDQIEGKTALPNNLVRDVEGENLYSIEGDMVNPITTFPVQDINDISRKLVEKHRTKWTSERILKQKHGLRGVPVSEASYTWKEKPGKFWVYGYEHKVYFPKYPHNCCCCYCCTII
ncbi:protein SSUH2 homolog [Ptychodera flava]|uniref:protein SSUH2 homolog n=1 Tax=Ptychodera flava TaxID=63121 RepID=UPI00396A0313